jgi:hypothetical protein
MYSAGRLRVKTTKTWNVAKDKISPCVRGLLRHLAAYKSADQQLDESNEPARCRPSLNQLIGCE